MTARRRIIIHNHLSAHDAPFASPPPPKDPKREQQEQHKFYDGRSSASDTWYHEGQVNGYYILRGEVGDKGRYLVRNGKYDIVKNANSKAEAVSFAKSAKHGGIKEPESIAADRRSPPIYLA